MATAEEFEKLLGQYENEQDPKKKVDILEKMRANILERDGNNDEFKTLYTNRTIRISQAGLSELIEISRSMETIKKQKQREILNDEERERELKKRHLHPDFNNPIH